MKTPKEPRILPRDYYQKDADQEKLQKAIDEHNAKRVEYHTVESKINQ